MLVLAIFFESLSTADDETPSFIIEIYLRGAFSASEIKYTCGESDEKTTEHKEYPSSKLLAKL